MMSVGRPMRREGGSHKGFNALPLAALSAGEGASSAFLAARCEEDSRNERASRTASRG